MHRVKIDDTSRVEWGKEWKWGIVKNPYYHKNDPKTYRFPPKEYIVVEHAKATFVGEHWRVANNLTHEEAEAMCAILNAGGSK